MSTFKNPSYGITRRITDRDFATVVEATIAALKTEGFGVLTQIDVKATLKKKIDVDFDDYLILGACNPPLAHEALLAERAIGLLLPCNVVVAGDGDGVAVSAIDPEAMFSVVGREDIAPMAKDVGDRLRRVMERI